MPANEKPFLERIMKLDSEQLLALLRKGSLGLKEQGFILLRLMDLHKYNKHGEIADLLNVSRPYISIRIKEARAEYPNEAPITSVGRPRHKKINVKETFGEEAKNFSGIISLEFDARISDEEKIKQLEKFIERWKEEHPEE
jgi:hypothetical protein